MIDDYLYNEEVQLFPTPPKKSATNSILKQKEIRKRARKKSSKQLKNQRSRLLYQKQSYNRNLNKDFNGLSKENKKVETGASSILKGVQDILGFVIIAGTALFSLQKILEKMGTLSEGQTAFDLLKPSTYDKGEGTFQGGRYKETDEKSKIKNKIIKEARSQGIDPALALGLAEQESSFNPKAKSRTGARGIYQMTSVACKEVGIPFDDKLYDPDYNIKYGLKYLKWCLNHTKTVEEALFAWNSGIGNLKKAKKAGDDLGTWNSAKKVGKAGGFTTQTLPRIQKYQQEISKLDEQALIEAKNTQTGTIADKYGGSFKGVGNVGNYTVKNDVIMSGQMEEFLKEVSSEGGSGRVTSVMDGNMHKGKKNGWNAASHYSGNKADIGLRGLDQETIIKQCVPIMRHPALVHIAFEGLGNSDHDSKRISKEIEKKIRSRYPDIDKRIKNKEFIVFHWGWENTHNKPAPHLDIRINPNKLKNVPKSKLQNNVNQENKNKPKETPKTKPKNKVETKVKGQVQGRDVTIQQSPEQKKNTKLINLNKVDPNRLKYQENEDYIKKGK